MVTTQSANATLALGASPIMSNASEEMSDLSKIIGGLLINIGTISNKACMLLAGALVFILFYLQNYLCYLKGRLANINRKPSTYAKTRLDVLHLLGLLSSQQLYSIRLLPVQHLIVKVLLKVEHNIKFKQIHQH